MNKINVGIAGLGFGESVHYEAIKDNENFSVSAFWHPREIRIKEASTKHNVKGYQNWSELITDNSIDALIIATPPSLRFELAIEALSAGKHLLLEKPVCLNSEQILEIQKLSIKKQLSVAVDFEYRAVPHFLQANHLIKNGAIGDPWLVKIDWLMSSRAEPTRPWDWYSDKDEGGGVLGALGTHAFDTLHWLIGDTKTVMGNTYTSIKSRPEKVNKNLNKSVTSEDVVLTQLEIETAGNKSLIPAQVNLSAVTREGRGCWIEIYGSDGTLILGSENQKDYVHGFGLWFAKKGEPLKSISPNSEYKFKKTWQDGRIAPVSRVQNWWAKSIYSSSPVIPGLSEGFKSQKVCDAIKESTDSGMKITI